MQKILGCAYLLTFIAFSSGVIGSDCHAILKIRATDNRPADFAIDGCVANPVDSFFRTIGASRVPHKDGLVLIYEQCNACCQARAKNCFGYITGNWIDVESQFKPQKIFELINVKFEDLVENEEADCICLEKTDVHDDMDQQHRMLIQNIRTTQNPVIFNMLEGIVNYWNTVPKYLSKMTHYVEHLTPTSAACRRHVGWRGEAPERTGSFWALRPFCF